MELNIEEALQLGIAAYNEGNLQDAERIYRAILQSHPLHSNANYNLGVVAVSLNNSRRALPLFKNALESNPKEPQFWFSYIDALIKEKEIEDAKHTIQQGKRQGIDKDKLNELETKLGLIIQTNTPNDVDILQKLLRNLQEYCQKGQFVEAEKLAISTTQKFPDHQFAWKVLGALFGQSGRHSEALHANQTAAELSPKDFEAYYNLGITFQELGRFREAEVNYKKAIVLKPDFAEAYGNLGNTLQEISKFHEAKSSYEKAIILQPDNAAFYSNLGNALFELGRFREAEANYKKAIALQPDFVEALSNLGNTLKECGELKQAEASFKQAIELRPDYALAHYNLGITLQGLGELDEAEVGYKNAIKSKPDFADAHTKLGEIFKKLGRLEEAEASFRNPIKLRPNCPENYYNLGNILQDLGKFEEAEPSFTQAIKLKPDFTEAHSNLGNTLKALGRLDEAEASYKRAINLQPGYAKTHYNLGITLQESSRLDEAEASYKEAIKLKPDFADAHSNLGNTLKALGRLDEAEASYKDATAIRPSNAEALHNLSIVQSYLNNSEAETFTLQRILRIDPDNYGLIAGVNLAIRDFLKGDFEASKKHLMASEKIQEKVSPKFKNAKVYYGYLWGILKSYDETCVNARNRNTGKTLYVIGESHSLTSHGLDAEIAGSIMFCEAKLIKGCKQHHLGTPHKNQYKHQFENIFCSLPKSSEILLAIGEIDCRLDSGIIKHKNKFPKKDIKGIITTTVKNYLNYVEKNNIVFGHNIIIQGVPCPNIDKDAYSEKEVVLLIEVINKFNDELKTKSREKGYSFLDVQALTNRGDGFSNSVWHIDEIHLSPAAMHEGWKKHIIAP